jgi:NADH:ubiquinone oxidoreductase subunit H
VKLQVADLNVGILYLFGMGGVGIVGAAIAGWASDNKFSLLGGLRAASQMVSYEVAMGMSLLGLFLIYGSVRMAPMVDWQGQRLGHLRAALRLLPLPRGPRRRDEARARSISPRARARSSPATSSSTRG